MDLRHDCAGSALSQHFCSDRAVVPEGAKAGTDAQSEPPFLIAQGVVLIAFLILGTLAVKRFRPGP
jgi:hypothetical protein